MSERQPGEESAEHRLRAREEQLRLVVESITDYGICQIGLDGVILAFNRGSELKSGYSRDEVIGRHLSILYQPEDAADGVPERLLQAAIATGRSEWEGWRVTRDGARYYDNEVFTAVRVGGEPVGIVKITRDRTDDLERETALHAAKAAAEAANRAKSDFLAQMSHELRTPLNSVIGFANVLRRNEGNRLQRQDLEHLDRIRQNALQLLGVIDGILDLSKVEARKVDVRREPVALAALIKETVAQMGGVRRDGVNLRIDLPAGPVQSVLTDSAKLRQVLINLLSNALRFTEEGHVLVRLVARDGQPQRIDVVDTGIGIPAARQDAIFEPFEQSESGTGRSYGGTGLGLAIATALCQRLGFTLSVQSESGRGSAFSINLVGEDAFGR